MRIKYEPQAEDAGPIYTDFGELEPGDVIESGDAPGAEAEAKRLIEGGDFVAAGDDEGNDDEAPKASKKKAKK
jgi:hypothetical protein